jgi:diguanylate cyclase (GGDEF)-like protein
VPGQRPALGKHAAAALWAGAMSIAQRAWMSVVISGAVTVAGWEAASFAARPETGRAFLFAGLMGCAVVCIEAARRLNLPAGGTQDLLTVWCLPVALLLPPLYALIAPAAATGLLQIRVRGRAMAATSAFRAAVLGLAGTAAAVAFRWLGGGGQVRGLDQPSAVVAAVGGTAAYAVVAGLLAGLAAHLRDPLAAWRDLLRNSESMLLDVTGLCAGVLVAIACSLSPALLLVALPPVVLLQRGLLHQHLRVAARTDAKTGLLHAVAWQREADVAIRRARRYGEELAILLADIDHFKRVNDTHGHLAGDEVLLAAAAALRQRIRAGDLLGRFGGEEFVVLLPRTGAAEACQVAERLRAAVSTTSVRTSDGELAVSVTVSIGVAALGTHGNELLELLTAADAALYRAKQAGRDQVSLPPPAACPSDPLV